MRHLEADQGPDNLVLLHMLNITENPDKNRMDFKLYTSDLIVRMSLVMETIIDLCKQELAVRNTKGIELIFKIFCSLFWAFYPNIWSLL